MLLLEQAELTVAEIQEILSMGQSRISTHLAQLKRAGLVRDRRAGKHIYYGTGDRVDDTVDPSRARLREIVAASAKEIVESATDRVALELVLRKREDRAREYFNRLAGRFGRSYCPGRSWQGMAHMLLGLMPPMVIADLGAGEGTLSQLLARTAKQVIAVDNSEKMVEFGSNLAREHGFANLEYRLGDIQAPPIEPDSVDLVIFSQALHHASHPGRAMTAAHRILKPGGTHGDPGFIESQLRAGARVVRGFVVGFQRVGVAPDAGGEWFPGDRYFRGFPRRGGATFADGAGDGVAGGGDVNWVVGCGGGDVGCGVPSHGVA